MTDLVTSAQTKALLDRLVAKGYEIQAHGIVRGAREVSFGSRSDFGCIKVSPKYGRILRCYLVLGGAPEVKISGVANVRRALDALPTVDVLERT